MYIAVGIVDCVTGNSKILLLTASTRRCLTYSTTAFVTTVPGSENITVGVAPDVADKDFLLNSNLPLVLSLVIQYAYCPSSHTENTGSCPAALSTQWSTVPSACMRSMS